MRSESLYRLADLIHKDSEQAETTFRNRARVVERFENRAFCSQCDGTILLTPVYMVKHPVWRDEAYMSGQGFLHIDCLQERIGRQLVAEDFTDAPCNLLVLWALKKGTNGKET